MNLMNKKITALIIALAALLLAGCGEQPPDPADYRDIAEGVCEANAIPFIVEGETDGTGTPELLLCGKIQNLDYGLVVTPDDEYFGDYIWPFSGDMVHFDNRVMFDARGKLFDYFDTEELEGRHIVIICREMTADSYPMRLVGQRVAIIID